MITITKDKKTCIIEGAGAYIVGAEFRAVNKKCDFYLMDDSGREFGKLNGYNQRIATTICYNDSVKHTLSAVCGDDKAMSGEFFAGYQI